MGKKLGIAERSGGGGGCGTMEVRKEGGPLVVVNGGRSDGMEKPSISRPVASAKLGPWSRLVGHEAPPDTQLSSLKQS
jgi:hypothetical protein